METKHTPTPWTFKWGIYGEAFTLIRNEQDYDPYIHVREEADAAFIVRAVNAYEELLGIAKSIESHCNCGQSCPRYQAIAKAQGSSLRSEGGR